MLLYLLAAFGLPVCGLAAVLVKVWRVDIWAAIVLSFFGWFLFVNGVTMIFGMIIARRDKRTDGSAGDRRTDRHE
jgi:hypothetical protein